MDTSSTTNSYGQHSNGPTRNHGHNNPNFTYIMREIVVKKKRNTSSFQHLRSSRILEHGEGREKTAFITSM